MDLVGQSIKFSYTKKDGSSSQRTVLVLNVFGDKLHAVDLDRATREQRLALQNAVRVFPAAEDPQGFYRKHVRPVLGTEGGYRTFTLSSISNPELM